MLPELTKLAASINWFDVLKAALILAAAVFAMGGLLRCFFGKGSSLVRAVSASLSIALVYLAAVLLYVFIPQIREFLAPLPFLFLSRFLHGSYGMDGVWMILLFLATRQIPCRPAVQLVLMVLLSLQMAGFPERIGIQFYAVLAMFPIFLYRGEKKSHNKLLQWCFTLFYPVHLFLLLLFRVFFRA